MAPAIARADAVPADAGVDAAAPAEATPPPDAQVQPAPAETPPPEEGDDNGDESGGKKKKKHKHDGEPDEVEGDLVSADDVGGAGGISTKPVNLRFLLQSRYTQSFVHQPLDTTTVLDPRIDDGFLINRAFLRATAKPTSWVEAKVLVDFAEFQHRTAKRSLKLAYAQIKPDPHFSVIAGLFKRSFSLLELLPIADYELANPGPTDDLIKNAELGGRDVGAMIEWSPLRKKKHLSLDLGTFGGGVNGADARPWGLVTARISSEPTKHWRFGVDAAYRHRGQDLGAGVPQSPGKGRAVSADVTWHHKKYEVRGEWLWGTRSDEDLAGSARTWMGAWGLAAVRFPVDQIVIMPAARFEWLDADLEHPIGRRYYITGAVNVMNLTDSIRVVLDVTRSQVQKGSFPLNIAPVLLDASSTLVIVQCQIKI